MAKVKFPLEMANGVMARNIDEIRENFELKKIVGYFMEGRLLTWLNDRYYEEEAEQVEALDKEDGELGKKLCEIFGAEYVAEVDPAAIARRNERIARLKQMTDDEEIIKNVDSAAFDQEELADLYEAGVETIYLCEGKFTIPKSKRELTYVEVGGAKVSGLDKPKEEIKEEVKEEKAEPEFEFVARKREEYPYLYDIFLRDKISGSEKSVLEKGESAYDYTITKDRVVYFAPRKDNTDFRFYFRMITLDGKRSDVCDGVLYDGRIIDADDSKVVWKNGDKGFFVRYYEEDSENRILKDYKSYGILDGFLFNDNIFVRKMEYGQRFDLDAENMKNGKRKRAILENVDHIKRIDKELIVYAGYDVFKGVSDVFYKVNMETMEKQILCEIPSDEVVMVKCFDVKEDKLVYITESDAALRLNVFDLKSKTTDCIDCLGKGFGYIDSRLKLDGEWIYYQYNKESGSIYRIRYDGSGKERFIE